MTVASVNLWGRTIGAVSWDATRDLGSFEYASAFVSAGIEVAPLTMPARPGIFSFPALSRETFKGLPGLLADSLPDKFGNRVIDAWLARQGRSRDAMNPVERLCYTGTRGMGALEFQPEADFRRAAGRSVEIESLVNLSQTILQEREQLDGRLQGDEQDEEALRDILRVGTSAGGARAKAVLAWNPKTGEFRSGQVKTDDGFEHWLMKFDGVDGNKDKELADPMGYGRLEYACYLMARDAGITMADCRLHEEGGRAHFMTKRFDRDGTGRKLHMQSLTAMRHFDFNIPRAHSYEQAIETCRLLGMPRADLEQQVRRAMFNIIIRNQDDHTKNIACLMDRSGKWRLSPAFDVGYAYNPGGSWTSQHQMSTNGKTSGFAKDDLIAFARFADIKKPVAENMLSTMVSVVNRWQDYATKAGVPDQLADGAWKGFRVKQFGSQ
jgi:serine/threonine-protein kinase HipA